MKSKTPLVEIRERQIALYLAYIDYFGKPENVYYPGCGPDATPGLAFPESNVVFLDIKDWRKVILTRIPNAKVIYLPTEEFVSSVQFDLVINMHSHAPFLSQVKDLKINGHLVIANKMSEYAFSHHSFELIGVVVEESGSDGNYLSSKLVTEELEIYEEEGTDDNPFSNNRKVKVPYYIFRKNSIN